MVSYPHRLQRKKLICGLTSSGTPGGCCACQIQDLYTPYCCAVDVERLLVCTSIQIFPLPAFLTQIPDSVCIGWTGHDLALFISPCTSFSVPYIVCLAQVLHSEVISMFSCLNECKLNSVLNYYQVQLCLKLVCINSNVFKTCFYIIMLFCFYHTAKLQIFFSDAFFMTSAGFLRSWGSSEYLMSSISVSQVGHSRLTHRINGHFGNAAFNLCVLISSCNMQVYNTCLYQMGIWGCED